MLKVIQTQLYKFFEQKSDFSLFDHSRILLHEFSLDNICALSNFQDIYFLWRPYLKDPKDDHVLEVAVASKTKTILTHNIKDFKGVEKFGIKAITPGKYLEEIK